MFFLQFGHPGDDQVQVIQAPKITIPMRSGLNHEEAGMPRRNMKNAPIARNISI
jgi:hypothetical protein